MQNNFGVAHACAPCLKQRTPIVVRDADVMHFATGHWKIMMKFRTWSKCPEGREPLKKKPARPSPTEAALATLRRRMVLLK